MTGVWHRLDAARFIRSYPCSCHIAQASSSDGHEQPRASSDEAVEAQQATARTKGDLRT